MGWKIHNPGADPEYDQIVWRRFGRNHDHPCKRPGMLTCALWKCQSANACQATALDTEAENG